MKQTAVEWLRELYENQPAYDDFILDEQWEQAKAIEKWQMIDFARLCLNKAKDLDILSAFMNVQQYYNETYGGKDQL
jgi:hypothetical protein